MNILPKVSQLQVFMAIVRNGGFNKAAKVLNLTQPALTHSMNELERSLGVPLFVRRKQGVHLTKAGEVLDERAQLLISTYENIINDVKRVNEEEIIEELSVGVSSFSLFSALPSKISDFQTNYPETEVKIVEDELIILLKMLRTGKLDLIIHPSSEHFLNSDLVEEAFFNAKMCILISKDNPLSSAKSIIDFNDSKWFLPKSKVGYYNSLKSSFKDKLKYDGSVFFGGGIMSLLMTLESDFITLVPEIPIGNSLLGGRFYKAKIKESLPDISYKIVYLRHFPLKKTAMELITELRGICH